jgi:hypothetical protein
LFLDVFAWDFLLNSEEEVFKTNDEEKYLVLAYKDIAIITTTTIS